MTEPFKAHGCAIGFGGKKPVVVFSLLDAEMQMLGGRPVEMTAESARDLAERLLERLSEIEGGADVAQR